MKRYLIMLSAMLVLASCSTPKYTYYFDHYNYNSGKKNVAATTVVAQEQPAITAADESQLIASASNETAYLIEEEKTTTTTISKEEAIAKLQSSSKEERKELKKELKSYVKEMKKSEEAPPAAKARLENDVKLAAIFGAVGIVLLIIGGDILSILGAVALLVGLYFFIRWLMHQ